MFTPKLRLQGLKGLREFQHFSKLCRFQPIPKVLALNQSHTLSTSGKLCKHDDSLSKPKKSGSVAGFFQFMNTVDAQMAKLENESPERTVAQELMSQIETTPELLALLSLFHYELALLGITPNSARVFTRTQIRWYKWVYLYKLSKIHDIFWDQCAFLEIALHPHKLGFLPENVGVLDPLNFTPEQYLMLQTGVYNGIDFKDIYIVGTRWSSRKKISLD